MEVTSIEPLIQGGVVGGGLLAAVWAIYSKLRAQSASDGASVDRHEAESSLYEKLRAEIDRAAGTESEMRIQLTAMREDMDDLKTRCDAERLEAFGEISKLNARVDTLTAAVNECQARHLIREEQDEQGRLGIIDRRAPAQPPRGRRNPRPK